ncbi:MAG: SDR family oxidoreductase [Bacteroidetes bacterium]|nr:MAG: SDR family oxidoreductase [Bacteroidota bacterium]
MPAETVLITGASSGIGLELARLFAADGSDLVLVARREAALQRLAADLQARHGITAHVAPHDLADPAAPQALYDRLAGQGVTVDVVVNNAGFGAHGAVAELDLSRQLAMIQVNVTALTHLTRLFLPGLLARNRGGVLNVASTAAFQPGPYMAVYYATKAYVLSFTEALAEEVAETNLTVTCLCPGPTDTGFADEAGMAASRLFRLGAMEARTVARRGYEAFRDGRVVAIPGLKNKAGAAGVRFLPRAVVRRLVRALQA